MARSDVHLLRARSGVDVKQLVHQRYRSHRHGILLVEFQRVHKLSARVRPACSMDHLRPDDPVVGRVTIGLQMAFIVAKKTQRPVTLRPCGSRRRSRCAELHTARD